MRINPIVLIVLALVPVWSMSQQVRDELDVLRGSSPTLRYGFYTKMSGQVEMGRFYFVDNGDQLQVSLVPYGMPAVELPVTRYDRNEGLLVLGWQGRPERMCRLIRQNEELFLASCVEKFRVLPIAIRLANEFDDEWMGKQFLVSDVDLKIIDRAIADTEFSGARNLGGDRNCLDDIGSRRFSVFCALYAASIDVDGVYRHRRPAMQAARASLKREFPGDYAHTLRDINNTESISDAELEKSLVEARKDLKQAMGSRWE